MEGTVFMLQTTAQGRTEGNQGTSGVVPGLARGNRQKGPCFLGDAEARPMGVRNGQPQK